MRFEYINNKSMLKISIFFVTAFIISMLFVLPIFKTYERYTYLDINSGLTYNKEIYLGFYEVSSRCHVNSLVRVMGDFNLRKEPHKWINMGGIFYYGVCKGRACSDNKKILLNYLFLSDLFKQFETPKSEQIRITTKIVELMRNGVDGKKIGKIINDYAHKILDKNEEIK